MVFQVPDVFDALANDRSYRPALPVPLALSILCEEAERGWWDRDIVEVFCRLIEEQGCL